MHLYTLFVFLVIVFRSVPQSFIEALLKKLSNRISESSVDQVESSLHSTIVLSYTNLPAVKFIQKLDNFITHLCTCIEAIENTELKAKLLYCLLVGLRCRLKYQTLDNSDVNKIIVLAAKYINCSDYLCSLRILDSLVGSSAFECLNPKEEKMRLIDNLSSPFHKVI